jgi:hypothetical protein
MWSGSLHQQLKYKPLAAAPVFNILKKRIFKFLKLSYLEDFILKMGYCKAIFEGVYPT